MLILAIGDAHIPDRAVSLPEQFAKLLVPGKINQVITLGNISDPSTLHRLKNISSDVQSVKGEFDLGPLPLTKVFEHGELKIGIVSGFTIVPNDDPDALVITAKQLDVDVLLWGGSHILETYELENKFFVNPGSCTGAITAVEDIEQVPSFVLLDIQGKSCVVYIYSIIDDTIKVEKVTFKKS